MHRPNAVYKGLALATAASGPQLYATDFVGTFAKQDPASADEQHHQGFGVVDAFDTDGKLISRVATPVS